MSIQRYYEGKKGPGMGLERRSKLQEIIGKEILSALDLNRLLNYLQGMKRQGKVSLSESW